MKNITLSNQMYNFLKWMTLIGIPAMSSLYFSLASTWDLPNAERVVGTFAILATTLGTVLGISTKGYEPATDGNMLVDDQDHKTVYSFSFNKDAEDLQDQEKVTFKVKHTNQLPEGFAE